MKGDWTTSCNVLLPIVQLMNADKNTIIVLEDMEQVLKFRFFTTHSSHQSGNKSKPHAVSHLNSCPKSQTTNGVIIFFFTSTQWRYSTELRAYYILALRVAILYNKAITNYIVCFFEDPAHCYKGRAVCGSLE